MSGRERGAVAQLRAAALSFGLAALLAGCGGQAAALSAMPTAMVTPAATAMAGPPVATKAVSVRNFAFKPPAITVPVGTTVNWTNDDIEQHTATADDKSFDSDVINNGNGYSFTFSKVGTFRYSCLIHPDMRGQVIVTAK